MNPYIKIKRIASSSIGFRNPSSNIKIKLKYKKNSLSKLIKDLKYIRYKSLNKNNSVINYNGDLIFNNKPKTSSKSYRYYNEGSASIINDNESMPQKEIKTIKINNNKKPVWNYSYYFNEKNKNKNYYRFNNQSAKKIRIKKLLDLKNPYIIEDWQKPRMIKILEKNSLIEEEIMLKPWKFFPNINNY